MTVTASLFASAFVLLAQVGPNPDFGAIQGVPDELLDRPPRGGEVNAPLDPASQWLSECLDVLDQDAARAHTLAQIQRNATEGPPRVLANHCLGLAATQLQLWDDATTAFLAARDETPLEEPSARARFGTMAGNAALVSGDFAQAVSTLRRAKLDASDAASATLYALAAVDLVRAMVALGRPDEEALIEIGTATSIEPDLAEGWLLQATLLRRLDRLDEAQSAIERAEALASDNPEHAAEIRLEAGVIAVLTGQDEVARARWQLVRALAPQSPAALAAQDYLAQLGPPVDDSASSPAPAEETP